jgi:predicted RNA polymerase sigma factor
LKGIDDMGRTSALDRLYFMLRADLLQRLKQNAEAGEAYQRAAALAKNPAEVGFLNRRSRQIQPS